MLAAMRDTSLDYRTYWLRDGLYFARRTSLGDLSCTLPAEKLAQIPADDRKVLVEETNADPAFCKKVSEIMWSDPDWVHTLSGSAKAAAFSEIDPKTRGTVKAWPRLRARVRALLDQVTQEAHSRAALSTAEERLATVKAIAAGSLRSPARLSGLGNLGQWDIIGSLVGSLANVGANIYGAKVTADAQQDIAKLQASAAMQTAQAQMAIANANAAIAGAQAQISNPVSSAVSSLTSATVAGVPVIIPVVAALAAGLWLAFRK